MTVTTPASEKTRLRHVPTGDRAHLLRIARRIADPEFGPGALASLRRGEPAIVARQPSFHRLVRSVDDRALSGEGTLRWATAVHVLAQLAGGAGAVDDVGAALAHNGFPESRLARLLASRGASFRDQAVLTARFLRAKGAACRATDLAELALVEERAESRAERLRHRIARSYYQIADAGASH